MQWNVDGTILAFGEENHLYIWEENSAGTWVSRPTIITESFVSNYAWSATNTLALLITSESAPRRRNSDSIVLYTRDPRNTWKILQTISLTQKPTIAVILSQPAIAWHPNNTVFAVLTEDSNIHIFTQKDELFIPGPVIEAPDHSRRSALCWSPDGQFITFSETSEDETNIVFLTPQPTGAYGEVNRIPTIIKYIDNLRPASLVWSHDSKKIAVQGCYALAQYPLRVYAFQTEYWDDISAGPTDPPKVLHWNPDGLALYSIEETGIIRAFAIDFPEVELRTCSVNQLMILIILQALKNTELGRKKIRADLKYAQEVIATFPAAVRTALAGFFDWITDKPVSITSPTFSAPTFTIKNSLAQFSQDIQALNRKMR